MQLINLELSIVILKKKIITDMHHRITYRYINVQQNRVSRSIKTVYTIFWAKNRKLQKFATTNRNFEKIDYFRRIIVKRTCISIFSKIGLSRSVKTVTQIYLQKITSCIINYLKLLKIFF